MALSEYRPASELISAVLKRCGLGPQSEVNRDLFDQVLEFIKEAQAGFWHNAKWLRKRTRESIALIADQTEYDFPDDMDAGSIDSIFGVDDNGRQWALTEGIRAGDRTSAAFIGTQSFNWPNVYTLRDGIIEVLPAPGDTSVELVIEGWLSPSLLTEEGDRLSVDEEACIRYAVIKLQKFKRMITAQESREEMADLMEGYVADLMGDEAVGDEFSMGTGYLDSQDLATVPSRQRPWWLADRRP